MLASLLACAAVAQAPAQARADRSASTSKAARRAQDMREQVSAGRILKSHVKVRVRLQNGSRLTGVVKDGRLVERVDGLHFVRASAEQRGAGVRLYYTSGTRGFVFVPFHSLKSYEVLQRLSQQQVLDIEAEMQREEQRASERRARAAALEEASPASAPPSAPATPAAPRRAAPPGPDGLAEWRPTAPAAASPEASAPAQPAASEPEGGVDAAARAGDRGATEVAEEGAAGPTEEQQRWAALLRQYPPEQGWDKAKRDEISRRFVVIGVQPSALEKAFVAQFEEWCKACRSVGVDPDAAATAPATTRREQRRAERARSRPGRK